VWRCGCGGCYCGDLAGRRMQMTKLEVVRASKYFLRAAVRAFHFIAAHHCVFLRTCSSTPRYPSQLLPKCAPPRRSSCAALHVRPLRACVRGSWSAFPPPSAIPFQPPDDPFTRRERRRVPGPRPQQPERTSSAPSCATSPQRPPPARPAPPRQRRQSRDSSATRSLPTS
jgi:hypothetical protein